MRILGIDPGTGRLGWGLINKEGRTLTALDYGLIETTKNSERTSRLVTIYYEISRVITKAKPDLIAVEELFFSRNVTTAMAVAEARGVVLLAAGEKKIPVVAYSPMTVKSAIGFGGAKKRQVQDAVKMLLKIKGKFKADDVADALAVAMCAAQQVRR